jgi:tetratricopeptide (TPR) repeat protein
MRCISSTSLAKRLFQTFCAVALVGLVACCGAGCNANQNNQNKVEGQKQWNAARAGILANLAKEQYENGTLDQARESIDNAIKLYPEAPLMHILSAKIAIEEGRLESADKALAEARRLDARNAEADYLSGVVCERWQKLDQAAEFYRAATEKQPQELAYLLAQAETMVALNRSDEALALLGSKVVYFEHSPVIRDAVGQLYMQKGKYDQAADMFRQASVLATDEPSIRERLAMAYLRCKRYNDACETLTRLLKNEKFAKRGDLFLALGEAQMQLGRTRDARGSFDTATQLEPNDASAWIAFGKAALELGDVKRAEICVKRAASIDAGNSEAYLLTGYVRLKQNNLDEALVAFRKASALDAKDSVSVCMVGYVLEKKGKGAEALKQYARALKLKPGDELATRLMAEVQLNQ